MIPKRINGQWRIVNGRDEIVSNKVFDSWEDACAYIDKFEDLWGQI